uniref:Hexosyltransferase n=1 Tax=Apteryx owenii TaxID=8824 RepID=A0A8B9Q9B5_APTOW
MEVPLPTPPPRSCGGSRPLSSGEASRNAELWRQGGCFWKEEEVVRRKRRQVPWQPPERPGKTCASELVVQILKVTGILLQITYCSVPVSVMYIRQLKWIFLSLLVFSVIAIWYITLSSNTVIERTNAMYFYEYEPIYKQHYLFTLRQRLKCEDINPFLVILVSSEPKDVKSRQAIRITWGSKNFWWGHRVLTLFLLGQEVHREDNSATLSVEDESILYGDIIRQDFMDTYDNLTLKTIMAFRWVTEFCSNARFLMKTDADVFINTGNLVKFLLKLNSSENIFTGYPLIDNFAYRGFYKKTYISYDEYPFRLFPPYCSGMGYILDGKLALRIYELMSHIKPIKFEDVYVGICLSILKVNISIPEDKQFFLYKINFDICKYRHLIAVHGITSSEIIRFWQDLSSDASLNCL